MSNRILQLFLELVRIDSPSGLEDQICQYLISKLKALGLSPAQDSFGNLFVKVKGAGAPILLAAHLDTVEPGRGVVPVVEEGIVRSQGPTILGADNKAGVALILDLLYRLHEEGGKTRNLEIVFTRSEEIGNYGAVNLDYTQIKAKKGYIFDNPNPIGTIITAAPFYNRFDVSIQGKPMHASKPELGINALSIAVSALQGIKMGRVDEVTTLNIGVIKGGYVRNAIMGDMVLQGEVRSFGEKNLLQATDNLVKAFQDAALSQGAKVSLDVVRENGGFSYSASDPDVVLVKETMKSLGIAPKFRKDWGCSDANIFVDHGIKTINLGDGTMETHTPSEQIKVSDMLKLESVIWALIQERKA